MPAAIPLAIIGSTVGGIASSAIGSHAASSAADAQAQAAANAANLQHQDAQAALDFNKLQYGNTLALGAPYYNSGVSALSRLNFLMGLTPQQGLPQGVVNPNAPPPASAGSSIADRIAALRGGDFGGDQVLPMTAGRGLDSGGNLVANRFSSISPAMRFGDTG